MEELIDLKKKIRQEVLNKRKQLSTKEIYERSEKICKQFVKLEEFQKSKTVLNFVSMPDEVQTSYLFCAGFDHKKSLVVPIVRKAPGLLLLSELSESHIKELLSEIPNNPSLVAPNKRESMEGCRSTNWFRSKFGILEPRKDTVKPVPISEIELIVVPGLGFGKDGMRVGFGGGHYDRLLARTNNSTPTVAVAFDFQIYDSVPHNDHDKRVDMIITDKEVIKP